MYCNHYQFNEKPFDVTPDPRFLYLTEDHRETLASLIYGIRERRGFITIIGEVGTGKTTLLNAAIDRLDEKTRVAFIFNTNVTFNEMLNMALYEWGLNKDKEKLSKVNAIQRLNNFAIEQLANGGNVVLIVDEAQNLDKSAMENLRLLSNLETRRHKLVQIVLSGQPELDNKLSRHELRQFAQRISLRRYVHPLDEKETYAYLQHRLAVAKHKNSPLFTENARKLIWEYSGGVPRKINILCDNAFLIGYGLKKNKIKSAVVKEAAQDLKSQSFSVPKASLDVLSSENTCLTWVGTKPSRRSFKLTATMITAGILIFAGSFFLSRSFFLNSMDLQVAKLTSFFSNIKGSVLETVHQDPTKQKVKVLQSDTTKQLVITQKINTQKVLNKDIEPKTQIKNNDVSYLTVHRYHLLNEKNPAFIFQDNDAENMWQVTELNENDRSEIRAVDKEKSDLSIPETQVDDKEKSNLTSPVKEEKIIRQIVAKKGDTLHRIIVQMYGEYDDIILNKVQRQNPKIIDPNLILEGQVINFPVNRGQIKEE